MSLSDNVFREFGQFKTGTALVTESGETVSYAALLGDADRIAAAAEPRSLAFLVCRNDAESVAAYVGFLRGGVVPLLINDATRAEQLAGLRNAYRPEYIFIRSSEAPANGGTKLEIGDYSLVRTEFEADYEICPDLALLLSTSGSTGSPKLVRQSHENISSNTRSIIEYLRIRSQDRAITTLPMSYTYGLSIITTHLCAGAAVILTNKTLMDREFWAALKTHGATTFGGVPYTYEMLRKLRFDRMELPSLRYLTQAGGKLSPELSAEFAEVCARKGMEFIVMYGQAEATARMSYLPWEYSRSKAGSIGIAIPGGEFSLRDDAGNEITTPGVAGELIYRGRNVTMGYAEDRRDLARGDERGGTLETGDMAKFDGDGFYYIVGRKKRFLKLFGNRVSLDEVEGLLRKAGYDCACGGTDDNLRVYATDDPGEVRRYVLSHTGVNPAGFSVIGVAEIPRNSSGKVLYSKLEG
jgi:acyl-coenzyme A synthetase/AMP-(fatty) acid ligase